MRLLDFRKLAEFRGAAGLRSSFPYLVHIHNVSLFVKRETETSSSLCQELNSHCRWVTQKQQKKGRASSNKLSVFKCKMTDAFMLIYIIFLFQSPIYSIYEHLSYKCYQWDLFLQSMAAGYQFISIVPVNPISCQCTSKPRCVKVFLTEAAHPYSFPNVIRLKRDIRWPLVLFKAN